MIKGFSGQDDFRSMAEVIERRLTEYEKASQSGVTEGFGRLPDLILLDGGKGQVNAVLPVLASMGITVPIFGMVKDGKHRTSAIATGGGRIEFNAKRKAFALVTSIQDEVHRFAVQYHRKKHTKSALSASLMQIKGVGEAKAKALILKFSTLENIRNADIGELCSVPGITAALAEEIYRTLHGE